MKINITKKEYKALLDVLSIADWVLNAHKVEEDPRTEEYKELEQKLFSCAEKMGCENLIEYDPKLERYFPTKEYDETSKAMDFTDEFEDDSFWEELIHRLVGRDLIMQEGGPENVMKLSWEERIKKEIPLEEMYAKEFEINGLNNLKID